MHQEFKLFKQSSPAAYIRKKPALSAGLFYSKKVAALLFYAIIIVKRLRMLHKTIE